MGMGCVGFGVNLGIGIGIGVDTRWTIGWLWLWTLLNVFQLLLLYFIICLEFIRYRVQGSYDWVLGAVSDTGYT